MSESRKALFGGGELDQVFTNQIGLEAGVESGLGIGVSFWNGNVADNQLVSFGLAGLKMKTITKEPVQAFLLCLA